MTMPLIKPLIFSWRYWVAGLSAGMIASIASFHWGHGVFWPMHMVLCLIFCWVAYRRQLRADWLLPKKQKSINMR